MSFVDSPWALPLSILVPGFGIAAAGVEVARAADHAVTGYAASKGAAAGEAAGHAAVRGAVDEAKSMASGFFGDFGKWLGEHKLSLTLGLGGALAAFGAYQLLTD